MAVVGEQIGRSDPSPTPIIQRVKAIVNPCMGLLFLVVLYSFNIFPHKKPT